MEEENSLIRKLLILWNGKKIILTLTFILAVLSLAYSFYLPPIYKAECHFLPPNKDMAKLGVFIDRVFQGDKNGGFADSTIFPDTVTSGQMMLGVIKRDSVVDAIIDKFSLMEVYQQDYRIKMREMVVRKLMETNEDTKSGIISIGILDEDPQRAADIANAFVETLQEKMLNMSLNDAIQRRVFFEKQLFKARQYLDDVQNEMLKYQEDIGGVAIPQSQMEATLQSITEIQQQIAEKKVEISAMSTYAPPTNPRLRAANSQLEALTKELERLEEIQKNSSPQLSVEYQRYEMRVQYATKRYETVLQQLEDARIDEAQGFFQLQIVDYATPPDYKYKPSKARIIIVGTFLGILLGCFVVVFKHFFYGLKKTTAKFLKDNPEFMNEYEEDEDLELREGFSFSKLMRHVTALAPFLIMAAAILLLTFQPTQASEELSTKFQEILKNFFGSENSPAWVLDRNMLRTFAHIALYFPLSAAIFYCLSCYGVSWGKAFFASLIISAGFGLADESIKIFLAGREFDFADWTLDIIGSLAGIIFASICKLIFVLKFPVNGKIKRRSNYYDR